MILHISTLVNLLFCRRYVDLLSNLVDLCNTTVSSLLNIYIHAVELFDMGCQILITHDLFQLKCIHRSALMPVTANVRTATNCSRAALLDAI